MYQQKEKKRPTFGLGACAKEKHCSFQHRN